MNVKAWKQNAFFFFSLCSSSESVKTNSLCESLKGKSVEDAHIKSVGLSPSAKFGMALCPSCVSVWETIPCMHTRV